MKNKRLFHIIFSLFGLIICSGISINQAKADNLTVVLTSPQPNAGQSLLIKSGDTADLKAKVSGDKGKVTYNWIVTGTSQNSIPNTASPGTVAFDQAKQGGGYSITINVSDSGATNCTNNKASNNLNLFDPGFYFNNESQSIAGSFYIPSNWTLQNGIIPVSSDVTVWAGPSVDMSSIDASDSSGGNWTLVPGSGSTDGNGNFTTTISTQDHNSLTNTDVTAVCFFEANGEIFSSEQKNVYPAVFSDEFSATLYYTPKESGFTANTNTTTMPFSGRLVKTDFLLAVKQEGWGLLAQPVNGYNYLGYYQGAYHLANNPQTSTGNNLIPGQSAAGSPSGFIINSASIHTYNNSIQNTFNSSDWNIVDVGSLINVSTHVDLYYGDDNPADNGLRYGRPATPTWTGGNTTVSLTKQGG